MLIGEPRLCGRECFQLASLIYPDTILYEPDVKLSSDITAFKQRFREAMVLAVKTNKDVMFMYDSNHINDPIYVDYIATFLNLFDRDNIEMFDDAFSKQLITAQKEYMEEQMREIPNAKYLKKGMKSNASGNGKEFYVYESGGGKRELTDNEHYILAINKISNRFHIAINSNGLQDYKNLNRYNLLETKMTCIFLNSEPENPSDAYSDIEKEVDSKAANAVSKRLKEIKSKVHNNILDFYKTVNCDNIDEEVVEGLKAGSIPNEDLKLDYIAGMVCKGIKTSPHLDIPVSTNFNSKNILFLEMIKYLRDFLSTSLMIRHNYYDSLVEKTNDLSEFYESTVNRKKDLYNKNYDVTVTMLDNQDQLEKIEAQLEDINASMNSNFLRKKQQEALEKEVNKVISEKERRIRKIVTVIEQTTGADYEFILKNTQYGSAEDYLIKTLGQIVNEDIRGFRSRQELEILFMNSSHL